MTLDQNNISIIGAIIGDIIGSAYEWNNVKTTEFQLFGKRTDFTDDSVLTFATMDCILHQKNYTKTYQSYARKYPNRGWWYSRSFLSGYPCFYHRKIIELSTGRAHAAN